MKQTRASRAFGVQSSSFDQTYGPSPIVRFKRNRVRELLIPYLPERASILELNGGTGEDALFFRGLGHSVTYTDLSDGMIEQARRKFRESEWKDIQSIQASFEDLSGIVEPYDVVFSNLGGLNCTPDLPAVLDQVDRVLVPGGMACLVVMPPGSWWEHLSWLKGNVRMARRRRKGKVLSQVEGKEMTTWYYPSSTVRRHWKDWVILEEHALCLVVPPEHMRKRFLGRERILRWLERVERSLSGWPIFRTMGDYFVIIMQKPID